MRLEDSSPADFLFGNLPEEINLEKKEYVEPNNRNLLEFLIVLVAVIYTIALSLLISTIYDLQITENEYTLILSSIGLLILLAAIKSIILLNRFGPDLFNHDGGLFTFVTIQVLMSYVFTGIILGSTIYIIGIDGIISSPIILILILIGSLIFYSRILSDVGLVSAGLGIGIVPSWGGLKNTLGNIQILTGLKGKKEFHLATLRILLWVFIYTIYVSNISIFYMGIGFLVFTILFYNWERVNSSSLVMQIRGKISEMSPSILPIEEYNPANFDTTDMEEPPETLRSRTKRGIHKKVDSSHKTSRLNLRNSSQEDLTPIAARSINKIANLIKSEKNQLKNNGYPKCKICGEQGIYSNRMCIECSKVSQANSSYV